MLEPHPEESVTVSEVLERLRLAVGDKYDVQRQIGRGGNATVFVARDLKHDREVAIKVLHPELSAAVGAERFEREIKLLARLQHPHILPLYDSGSADGSLYYVMPCVQGESLRERLERERSLPVEDAIRITRELADALAYAHVHGIVHRDIKPENILLSDGHASVADFGVARAITSAAGERITGSGIVVGTAAYMSPEQASGDTQVDGRSDIYSLACVLYEMLAGSPPFTGPNPQAVLARRFKDKVPPLSTVRPNLPSGLESAVLRAMALAPADRFTSAREFATALPHLSSVGHAAVTSRGRWRWWILPAGGAALLAIFFASRPLLFAGPNLDKSLYAVGPFAHRGSAAPVLLDGDKCALLLHGAFERWDGVHVVDRMRINDARAHHASGPVTLQSNLRIAESAGAGRLVTGEVWEIGDTIFVRGALYDVARRGTPRLAEHTVAIARHLGDATAKFNEMADSLLIGRDHPPSAMAGAMSTRSHDAWEAYSRGHRALATWDLAAAEREFRSAGELDPSYAHAHLWLAETLLWSGSQRAEERRSAAASAVGAGDRLGARDRMIAAAQLALAEGRFPDACESYRQALARDSLDFSAWFGLGECHRLDRLVIADRTSPSGWRFRSSYQEAVSAYRRALQIVPSVHLAFRGVAWSRLPLLLHTEMSLYRRGHTAMEPDSTTFGAFPALDGDTLAFVPHPLADLFAGRAGPTMASRLQAVERSRATLQEITTTWVRSFPESADAFEVLANVLETRGEIDSGGAIERSALRSVRRARALAADDVQRLRLAVAESRLLVKLGRFGAARAVADSLLLAAVEPPPVEAEMLAALAALTGRAAQSARLLARAAPEQVVVAEGRRLTAPLPVMESAMALLAYASLGAPVDSILAGRQRVERLVPTWVAGPRQRMIRDALLERPLMLAFPVLGADVVSGARPPHNYLRQIQWSVATGDSAGAREALAAASRSRRDLRPGDLSIDFAYQEAWLLAALGDTAGAVQLLDRLLGALPTLGSFLLSQVPQAAALVRSMALRAELAARRGETGTMRSWATAVVTLWGDADPELETVMARMRTMARGSIPAE